MLCTLMSHNGHEAEAILQLAEQTDVEGVLFQPVYQHFGDNREDEHWHDGSTLWPSAEQSVALVDRLLQAKRTGARVLNTIEQLRLMREYFIDPTVCRKACVASDASLVIECDGSVYACVFKPAGPLGNVRQATPRELWTSAKGREIRRSIRGCKSGCAVMNMNYDSGIVEKFRRYLRLRGGGRPTGSDGKER